MQPVKSHRSGEAQGTELICAVGALVAFAICCRFNWKTDGGSSAAWNSVADATGWQIPDAVLEHSTPEFACEQHGESPALIFCTIQTGEDPHHPAILIHDAGGWRFVEMADECFSQSGWVYVGATRDRKFMWGVSDSNVEDLGWDLEIMFSHDGGRSWTHIGTVHKLCYMAWLNSFQMGTHGKGWLTVYLDDAYLSGNPRKPRVAPKGYYMYSTRDGGRTWLGPRYSRSKPRTTHHILVPPSYAATPGSNGGIDEVKALMARMEGEHLK